MVLKLYLHFSCLFETFSRGAPNNDQLINVF